MPLILPQFTLGLYGTSLTQGRLDADWPTRLALALQQYPEAKGPIKVVNQGKGSQNSDWGLANIGLLANERCTHILTEGFSINDSALTDGVNPQVTIANHDANVTAMVAALRAARAGVAITIQTMNPVSAKGNSLRPNLAGYYARDVALAGTLGLTLLDNYNGVAGGPVGGWPKPLDPYLTNGASPWLVAPTAGYVGQDNVFDADHDASITVTPDGLSLTRTGTSGTTGLARALSALPGGTTHFEFTMTSAAPTQVRFGIANAAAGLTTALGGDANGIGLNLSTGQVFRNGTSQANSGITAAQGDTIGVEVDWAGHLIYFKKGATRSAGIAIPTGGNWVGAGQAVSMAGTNSVTAKFTDEGDGLHPIWAGAVDTYLYPNVITWARAKMAAFWP